MSSDQDLRKTTEVIGLSIARVTDELKIKSVEHLGNTVANFSQQSSQGQIHIFMTGGGDR